MAKTLDPKILVHAIYFRSLILSLSLLESPLNVN